MTWVRIVWDLGRGVALPLGAFNIRNYALRIYSHMANRVGVGVIFAPAVLRTTWTTEERPL